MVCRLGGDYSGYELAELLVRHAYGNHLGKSLVVVKCVLHAHRCLLQTLALVSVDGNFNTHDVLAAANNEILNYGTYQPNRDLKVRHDVLRSRT